MYVLCTNRVDRALTCLALVPRKRAPFQSFLIWLDWRRGLDRAHNPKVAGSNPAPDLNQRKPFRILVPGVTVLTKHGASLFGS